MMALQIISEEEKLLNEVADFLLEERLLANAVVSPGGTYKMMKDNGIVGKSVFLLKGISKSLLFARIMERLKDTFGDRTPLVYSEPIIMIDSSHTELLLERLAKV